MVQHTRKNTVISMHTLYKMNGHTHITLTIIKIWEIFFQRTIFSFLYEVWWYLNLRFICLVAPHDSLVWIKILYIKIGNFNGIFWNISFLIEFCLCVHKSQFLLPIWHCSFFRKKRGVLNNFHELPSPFLKNYEHEILLVVVQGMYHHQRTVRHQLQVLNYCFILKLIYLKGFFIC